MIIGRKASVGEVHFSPRPCYPIDTTYYVDQFHSMPARYWLYLLKNLHLNELNKATAIPGLNREDAYLSSPNMLFLLDEPESHFNPLWRVKFITRVLDLPTKYGDRRKSAKATEQECLLTTNSPFVPSDMQRDKVFIFSKDEEGKIQVQNPNIETFGSTFDTIIEDRSAPRGIGSLPCRKQIPIRSFKFA